MVPPRDQPNDSSTLSPGTNLGRLSASNTTTGFNEAFSTQPWEHLRCKPQQVDLQVTSSTVVLDGWLHGAGRAEVKSHLILP